MRFKGIGETAVLKLDVGSRTYTCRVAIEFITPEIAAEYLDRNIPDNRPIEWADYRPIHDALTAEEFMFNGATICFNTEGKLIDGQHRLKGCIVSGVGFVSLVVYDLAPAVLASIDSGKSRTPANVLVMTKGRMKNSGAIAQACRMLLKHRTHKTLFNTTSTRVKKFTSLDIIGMYDSIPDIEALVRRFKPSKYLMAAPRMTALYVILRSIDPVKAESFMSCLTNGANLGSQSPILELRNNLMKIRANDKTCGNGGGKTFAGSELSTALFIKAWNLYFEGKEMNGKRLAWSPSEGYPEIASVRTAAAGSGL